MNEASEEVRSFPDFTACLSIVQRSLGLSHYHITVEETPLDGDYADIQTDAANCVAHVRYDRARCEAADVVAETALHEALHLLLADLIHAMECSARAADVEQERIVRRLEPILARSIYGR